MNDQKFLELLSAAINNDSEKIRSLVGEGVDPNQSGPFGIFALRNACESLDAKLDALKALLDVGADPNRRFTYTSRVRKRVEKDVVALMYASNVDAAKLLVEYGADVDVQDAQGTTTLMRAAFWSKLELVEYFLSIGADPRVRQFRKRGRKAMNAEELATEQLKTWESFPVGAFKGNTQQERCARYKKIIEVLQRATIT